MTLLVVRGDGIQDLQLRRAKKGGREERDLLMESAGRGRRRVYNFS